MKIRKLIAAVLTLCMVLCWLPAAQVNAKDYSGTCGENLTWSFDSETQVLTIEGTGAMDDYPLEYWCMAPWSEISYTDVYNTVVISEGVTSIGSGAFLREYSLQTIYIPSTLTSVGEAAFLACSNLHTVYIASADIVAQLTSEDACGSLIANASSLMIEQAITAIPEYVTSNYKAGETVEYNGSTYTSYDYFASGSCGDDLTWELDAADCVLTIKGTGVMDNYEYGLSGDFESFYEGSTAPWYEYRSMIHTIVISADVAGIGENAFRNISADVYIASAAVTEQLNSVSESGWLLDSNDIMVEASIAFESSFLEDFYSHNENITYEGVEYAAYTFNHDGICGDYMVYDYDEDSGVLTIDGVGEMYDYGNYMVVFNAGSPFSSIYPEFTDVVICEGVTSIGACAFFFCQEFQSITIPQSLTHIGEVAFGGCYGLTTVKIHSSAIVEQLTSVDACGGLTESADTVYIESSIGFVPEFLENGYTYSGTITIDGVSYTYYSDKELHVHSYEAVVTPPTCTEQGYTTYICACGDSYVDDQVAALGHSYKAETTAPTCTKDGKIVYTCSCGDSYEVTLPATSHDFAAVTTEPTCDQDGKMVYTCGVCGYVYAETLPAAGHTAGEWTVVKEATAGETGLKQQLCTVCGQAVAEEVIPALGEPQPTEPETTAPGQGDEGVPNTGDNTFLFVLFAMLTLAAPAALVLKKRILV